MNRLKARLEQIERDGAIMLLRARCGDVLLSALLTHPASEPWQPGDTITLAFNPAEVALAKQLSGRISLRNRLPCTVKQVELGRLLARVELDFDGQPLQALISRSAALELELQPGDPLLALVKSTELAVLPAPQPGSTAA